MVAADDCLRSAAPLVFIDEHAQALSHRVGTGFHHTVGNEFVNERDEILIDPCN